MASIGAAGGADAAGAGTGAAVSGAVSVTVLGVLLAVTASAAGAFTGRGRTWVLLTDWVVAGGLAALAPLAGLLLVTTVRVMKGLAGGGWLGPIDKGAVLNNAMCTSKTTTVKLSKALKF